MVTMANGDNGDNGDNGGNGDGDGDGPGDGDRRSVICGRRSAVGGRGWPRGSWSWFVVRRSSLVARVCSRSLDSSKEVGGY